MPVAALTTTGSSPDSRGAGNVLVGQQGESPVSLASQSVRGCPCAIVLYMELGV
jgi:hypothetical protein